MAADPKAENSEPAADASQPEMISPAMRTRLQKCYEHGVQIASQKAYDHDYAHTMFQECAARDPSNIVYIEAMLANLQAKYKNNKKGAAFSGFGGKGAIKKLVAKKEWKEILKQGPELLKSNPWDAATLRALAEACENLGFHEVELRYLKNALEGSPKNADVARHCARSLSRVGLFDQAIAVWHRVEELKRYDEEAPKMIAQLSVAKARGAAGMGDEPGSAAKGAAGGIFDNPDLENEHTKAAEVQRKEIPLTPRQRLERELAEDPGNLQLYLQMADVLDEEQRYGETEKLLAKAATVSSGDLRIRNRLEDARINRARSQLQIAENRLSAQPNPDAEELVERLRGDLNRLELDIYQQRCQRLPEDLKLKYELALRLKAADNHAEAAKEFQAARAEPSLKAAATLEMGECCQQQRQYKNALECYKRAVELSADDERLLKRALYRAGILAMGMKDADSSLESFTRLVKLDPKYRDAADRLDKLKKIRHKG